MSVIVSHCPSIFPSSIELALDYSKTMPALEELSRSKWMQSTNPDTFMLRWMRYCYKQACAFEKKKLKPKNARGELLLKMSNHNGFSILEGIVSNDIHKPSNMERIDWGVCSLEHGIYTLYHERNTPPVLAFSEKLWGPRIAQNIHLLFVTGVYPTKDCLDIQQSVHDTSLEFGDVA